MQELKEQLISRGAALVGFADMRAVPEAQGDDGLPFAVSIAVSLDPAVVAEITDGPTREYLAHYKERNAFLDGLAAEAAEGLVAQGHRAVPSAATTHSGKARLPHKTAARLSGLGWIGKCALLVTEEYGAAVRLNTVLTDAPLPVDVPTAEGRCGDCEVCVKICPGGAPRGVNWRPGMAREDIFDVEACRAGIRKICEGRNMDRQICGMCVANCPWTEKFLKRAGR